jgi:hypothetical protein
MTIMDKIKRNQLLFFLFKIIRVSIIVAFLDFAIGAAVRHFYFEQKIGREYRATYTIENTKAEILIFGASEAFANYVPDTLEKKFHLTCYNSGSPGQFILYHYATLKAILKRYTPKMIFLDLTGGELATEDRGHNYTYERLSFLLPFYKAHPEMRPILDLKGDFEKYKLASSIYPFNSKLIYIAASNAGFLGSSNTTIKGWGLNAFPGVWEESLDTSSPSPAPLDSVKISVYKSFIEDCCKAGIKLVVVRSPAYTILQSPDNSTVTAKKLAKQAGVQFVDFTNDSFFLHHPEYFNAEDDHHLNIEGAKIFSRMIADSVLVSNYH